MPSSSLPGPSFCQLFSFLSLFLILSLSPVTCPLASCRPPPFGPSLSLALSFSPLSLLRSLFYFSLLNLSLIPPALSPMTILTGSLLHCQIC